MTNVFGTGIGIGSTATGLLRKKEHALGPTSGHSTAPRSSGTTPENATYGNCPPLGRIAAVRSMQFWHDTAPSWKNGRRN